MTRETPIATGPRITTIHHEAPVKTKRRHVVMTGTTQSTEEVVFRMLASPGQIQGLDVLVATSGMRDTVDIREGDVVVAMKNDYVSGFTNGDIGLVTRTKNDLLVDLGECTTMGQHGPVPLSRAFSRIGTLSYHRIQGMRFRSAVAIASQAEDGRHLQALLHATDDAILVGGTHAVCGMIGALTPDGMPREWEIRRRTDLWSGIDLAVTIAGMTEP